MKTIQEAVQEARVKHQEKHGNCSACAAGDEPDDGLHRGSVPCGNAKACSICAGCLPAGEQCKACYRINKEKTALPAD